MRNKIQEYINQDIHNPKYLFHGSPCKLDKIIPRQSHDSNDNQDNIANAVFLFPSFIKASAYAFKDTIKKNSDGLEWEFEVSNGDDYPVMIMKNVNIDESIIGYIYVFENNMDILKDYGSSLQYKAYKELVPVDVVPVLYRDYKQFYEVNNFIKSK